MRHTLGGTQNSTYTLVHHTLEPPQPPTHLPLLFMQGKPKDTEAGAEKKGKMTTKEDLIDQLHKLRVHVTSLAADIIEVQAGFERRAARAHQISSLRLKMESSHGGRGAALAALLAKPGVDEVLRWPRFDGARREAAETLHAGPAARFPSLSPAGRDGVTEAALVVREACAPGCEQKAELGARAQAHARRLGAMRCKLEVSGRGERGGGGGALR